MAEQFAAQCVANPSGGTVQVEVSGTTTQVAVASGLSLASGDVVLISKVGNRWYATLKLYSAPAWTPPAQAPPAPTSSGTSTFSPIETRSWRPSGWRTDNTRVYQGQYGGNGNHIGCAFYGTAPRSLAGATVISASVIIRRHTGGGYQGTGNNELQVARITEATRPGGSPTVQTTTTGPSLDLGQQATWTVPTAWAQALVDGTAGALGLYRSDGTRYLQTTGLAEYAGSWQLSITWSR